MTTAKSELGATVEVRKELSCSFSFVDEKAAEEDVVIVRRLVERKRFT